MRKKMNNNTADNHLLYNVKLDCNDSLRIKINYGIVKFRLILMS